MDATPDRRCIVTKTSAFHTSSNSKQNNQVTWVSVFRICSVGLACLSLAFPSIPFAQNITNETYRSIPGSHNVSISQLTMPQKVWDHLGAAHRAFSKGNIDGAEKEVQLVLKLAPACAPAFSMRALLKLVGKDTLGAVKDAEHAALLDPFDAESYVTLAMAYNSSQQFTKGEQAARRGLGLSPSSWQGRLEIAKSLYGQHEFTGALHELDLLDTDFPDVHLVRGNILMRLGRREEGKHQFQRFLEQSPNDPRCAEIKHIILVSEPRMPNKSR